MLESVGILKFSKLRFFFVENWDYGREGILECRNWKLEEIFRLDIIFNFYVFYIDLVIRIFRDVFEI